MKADLKLRLIISALGIFVMVGWMVFVVIAVVIGEHYGRAWGVTY